MTESNSSYKILCVDDEPDLLEMLVDILSPLGFKVLTAESGAAALELLRKEHRSVAVVISDIRMPEMDGFAFCREVQREWKQIPLLLVSAFVSREDALKALESRISGFLEKPFAGADIRALVEKVTVDRLSQLGEDRELLSGFVADTETLLEEMESLLLSLEKNPGQMDTIDRIFAIAHTVKGTSGFFKPDTVHKFTHKYEDFLSFFKKSRIPPTSRAIAALLQGLDTIKALITALHAEPDRDFDLGQLTKIFFDPASETPLVAAAAERAMSPAAPEAKKGRDDIRVSIELLNELMELSGEITVIRNMINKLVRTIEAQLSGNRDISYLAELLEEMHKVNALMQDKIVDLRKVPMRGVYRPLQRAVSDLTRTLGKEIEFRAQAEDLRIDASLAEALGSSLIHMVRNCADHGIENLEARAASGKAVRGVIEVSAAIENDFVLVTVGDDGKGINAEVIRQKIVEKKLFSADEAARMGVPELQKMIFAPGFSTAAVVTDVSGRGVGLDMVKKTLDQIGGTIEIRSNPGQGTQFQLKLPIPKSVTIVASLLVRCGGEVFAVPRDSIERLVLLRPEERASAIRTVEGADLLSMDEILCPLLRLGLITTDPDNPELRRAPQPGTPLPILLVRGNGARFGLVVDEILDIEEVVVKSLTAGLGEIPILLGATFLGDGSVGLILDLDGIAEAFHFQACAGSTEEAAAPLAAGAESGEYLLFSLGGEGTFAIRAGELFRLEEISRAEMQLSGNQPVVVYREDLLPLISAAECLKRPGGESWRAPGGPSATLQTLVIRSEGHFVGVVVDEILDLVSASAVLDEGLKESPGLKGTTVIHDKTIAVVNGPELIRLGLAGWSFPQNAGAPET
ncbi:MAG: chemotaxis protein CheW [Bdellovibrionota bacterium]